MKLRILILALVLVVAACSSSDDTTDGGDTSSDVTQTTADGSGAGDGTTTPPDTGGGEGPSTATATIGDETYEFSSEGAVAAQCLTDLFGVFSVQIPMADGGDGGISLLILHPDTDPDEVGQTNSVAIDVGDVTWLADPEDVNIAGNADVPEGQSQVDSAEVDGNTVRGTFSVAGSQTIYSADFVEFATGSFEATCGEERTS